MKKKLLIDVNSIVPYYTVGHVTGIGRSTMELINALNKLEKIPFDIILFSQNMKGIGSLSFASHFRKLHFWLPNRPMIAMIVNRFRLKKIFTNYALIHIPHNTDNTENLSKTIFTIHDLIVYHYPEMWGLTSDNRIYFNKVAKGCKAIVTCSQASKNDIISYWNVCPEKVTVIPWGINREIIHPIENKDYLIENGIKENNYFLCTACNHPRKNLDLILQAYIYYLKNGGTHQLVLLNPLKENCKKDATSVPADSLIILFNVSDKNLCTLYTYAKATIIASSYEGFGFPVLESLSCYTAVICAANSSLIELGCEGVSYFSEMTPSEIGNWLLKYGSCKKKNTINKEIIDKHLSNYTWQRCAELYIEFYRKQLNII